jgi:adenylate kinase family enzyme
MPQRVAVVGTTGAGKTTFAGRLATILGAKHVELDALYHGPNWIAAEPEVFRARVAQSIACERWVTDGNYNDARPLIWAAADTLVWLDYAFPRIISQLARRTVRRYVRREELWNGNGERFWGHFLPNDNSLFFWATKTHWRRRRTYPERLRQPECAHLRVVRLRSPRDAERYLAVVEREAGQLIKRMTDDRASAV